MRRSEVVRPGGPQQSECEPISRVILYRIFHRYIVCDSSIMDFWDELRHSLTREQSNMSVEGMLLAYWPNLKAVIGKAGATLMDKGPVVHPIWILAENVLEPSFKFNNANNPISTIIRLVYGRMSHSVIQGSLQDNANPVFSTPHEIETGHDPDAINKAIAQSVPPDATLKDQIMLGLGFYIVETRHRRPLGLPGTYKAQWIWRLCCLSRQIIRTTHFSMALECRRWTGVALWVYTVGFSRRFLSA